MKPINSIAVVLLLLASCKSASKMPMYYWSSYDDRTYRVIKSNEAKDIQKLMETYNEILMNDAKSSRAMPPPGVCADYGFFLVKEGKADEGKKWLEKEKQLYPESVIFIDRILKMTEK